MLYDKEKEPDAKTQSHGHRCESGSAFLVNEALEQKRCKLNLRGGTL